MPVKRVLSGKRKLSMAPFDANGVDYVSWRFGARAIFRASSSEFRRELDLESDLAWPIYVISLKDAGARRAACVKALGDLGLDFDFFDAIDGRALGEAQLAAAYDAERNARQYKRPLSRPEIGCYLSHHALWRRIVEENLEGAVILEDDFAADAALAKALEGIRRARLSGALVKLFARKLAGGRVVATLEPDLRLTAPNRVPGLTLGYALDRKAAELLLVNALPFSRPLDMDMKHWWEFGLPMLVVDPPPLRVGPLGEQSGIAEARDCVAAEANARPFDRFMANLRYQFDYNVHLFQARANNRRAAARLSGQSAGRK